MKILTSHKVIIIIQIKSSSYKYIEFTAIDTNINNLRDFVFTQAEEDVEKGVLEIKPNDSLETERNEWEEWELPGFMEGKSSFNKPTAKIIKLHIFHSLFQNF